MDLTFQFPSQFTIPFEIALACSDETTAITAAVSKAVFRMPFDMSVARCLATCTTAPTGASVLIDVNCDGLSILSTKLTIAATAKTSFSAATNHVLNRTLLPAGSEISVDFDQVGSTIAGAGVKVWLIGTRS
jgi:hypothetical protein